MTGECLKHLQCAMIKPVYPHVSTSVAGSFCVVELNDDYYIDARKDVRYPNQTRLEVVKSGQVTKTIFLLNTEAPEMIVYWIYRHIHGFQI